jgi:hypothetical protein
MKQNLYFVKPGLAKKFFWIALLPFLTLSCCECLEDGISASTDVSHQRFSGPSYDHPQSSKADPGFNLAYELEFWAMLGWNDNMAEETKIKQLGFIGRVEYASRTSHQNFSGGKETIWLNYLDLPLYLAYRTQPVGGNNFFGGIGPYFGYGLGGKFKSTFNGQTAESPAFGKNGGLKRFDMGLGLTAGYKTASTLSLALAYQFGLTNIEMDPGPGGDKTKNRSISLNVGYSLDKLLKIKK